MRAYFDPQQFLYFFPLPQGQGSLRPTLVRRGSILGRAAACPPFRPLPEQVQAAEGQAGGKD